jgi:hypothetical protein
MLKSRGLNMEINLIGICISSFIGVFFVLIFLAVTMEVITRVFPEKKVSAGRDDAAVFAAITSTYARLYPGTRIGNIEEIKNQK